MNFEIPLCSNILFLIDLNITILVQCELLCVIEDKSIIILHWHTQHFLACTTWDCLLVCIYWTHRMWIWTFRLTVFCILKLQKSAFICNDSWEYRTNKEVCIYTGFHFEEHWGMCCLAKFSWIIMQALSSFLFSVNQTVQSISSDILGFTGDEATRRNLKLLIKSLSRLLWRWKDTEKHSHKI